MAGIAREHLGVVEAISAAMARASEDPREITNASTGTVLRGCAVAVDAALKAVESNAAAAHELIDRLVECALKLSTSSTHDVATAGLRIGCVARDAAEFHAQVAAAEARKRAALETEAVQLDAALAAACAGSTFPFYTGHPVEPSCISVVTMVGGVPALPVHVTYEEPWSFRVAASTSIAPVDIALAVAAAVRPEPRQVLCELALTADALAALHPEDVGAALQWLARHTSASVSLVAPAGPAAPSDADAMPRSQLSVTYIPAVFEPSPSRSGSLELVINLKGGPHDGNAVVVITRMCIAGRPCQSTFAAAATDTPEDRACIPFGVPVCRPLMRAPCIIDTSVASTYKSLALSDAGELYAVTSHGVVTVFGADGAILRRLEVPELSAACVGALALNQGTLVLILAETEAGRVGAVDALTGALLWVAAHEHCPGLSANGIAVMPQQGLVVVSCDESDSLIAFRVVDGSRAAVVRAKGDGPCYYLACDEASGTLYAASTHCSVEAWVWSAATDTLVPVDVRQAKALSDACGPGLNFRLLAVVPASRSLPACLLVGQHGKSHLRALALPSYALLGEPEALPDDYPRITGLAADPYGERIALFDSLSAAVHVLAWPLPGLGLAPPRY